MRRICFSSSKLQVDSQDFLSIFDQNVWRVKLFRRSLFSGHCSEFDYIAIVRTKLKSMAIFPQAIWELDTTVRSQFKLFFEIISIALLELIRKLQGLVRWVTEIFWIPKWTVLNTDSERLTLSCSLRQSVGYVVSQTFGKLTRFLYIVNF